MLKKQEKKSKNFWQEQKNKADKASRPIVVLAPMADVTDAPFRRVIAKYGKPDVLWTEFVSADGLMRATPEGKEKLKKGLIFDESERPIVAQFFTSNPEHMKKTAELAVELGFDGIDINMGCPDKGIEKQNAGAAMMKNPKLAREIIRAAKDGAGSLPVSVKTRIGFNKVELETWLPELLAECPAVITIHARTRKEMSKVLARWKFVKRAVEIRDEVQKDLDPKERTLIFGNGDVKDVADAKRLAKETGCDGVMLGRAIFGNPWLFAELGNNKKDIKNESKNKTKVTEKEFVPVSLVLRLKALLEHTKLFNKLLGDTKNFAIMKKHFKSYVSGFDGSKDLREKLMEANSFKDVEKVIKNFISLQKTK